MKQLKGRINWVSDIFDYIGQGFTPKNDPYRHYSARISNAIVSEDMIEFYVEPHKVEGEFYSFKVNLLNIRSNIFKGKVYLEDSKHIWGEVECELYSNSKKNLIHGRWHEFDDEEECLYSFIIVLEK
ncbi:hypothetical protein [Flavobacterium filum]|uniref:hypothetical protein n=1 Tax=Flavobacterium filum TaxID=370974 RepID=UPI0023F4353F|nr:hypothetical protein [Flavobacterium filum]